MDKFLRGAKTAANNRMREMGSDSTTTSIESNDDYVPSNKKRKITPVIRKFNKNLTAKERIARLNDKIKKYHKNDNNVLESSTTTSVAAHESQPVNHDAYFVDNEEDSSERNTLEKSTTKSSPIALDAMDLLVKLATKVDELNATLDHLRRQVARMEAKTQVSGRFTPVNNHGNDAGLRDFYDHTAACKAECLPLRTCEDVVNFERKLKDPTYRTKIVSDS